MNNGASHILVVILCVLILPTDSARSQLATVTNFASGYFNTNNGYEPVFSLDGQPYYPTNPSAWATTDPEQPSVGGTNIGSTSIVQPYAFYTFGDTTTNGNNSVLFGGFNAVLPTPAKLLPGTTNPSLYISFAQSGSAAESATFSVDFAIRRPGGGQGVFTNRDSFGFTLWDSFGSGQIAKFMFNGSSPTVAAGTTNYGFQWFDSSNVWQSNSPALTATNWQIAMQSLYRLNVTLSNSGMFNADLQTLQAQLDVNDLVTNYAIISTTSFVVGGSMGGYMPGDISSLSVDWELASGDSMLPGANFLVMNQISLLSSVIPEPGTWAAGGILAVITALAVRRRRGTRTAA